PGFDNVTRDNISVSPDKRATVNLQMRISSRCECLAPPATLAGLSDRADSIVHLRITDLEDQPLGPTRFFKHTAEVLDVLKRHPDGGPRDATVTFLQDQSTDAPDPYDVGEELVVFLEWSANGDSFLVYDDANFAFGVRNGVVVRSPVALARYVGASVAALLMD